MGNTGRRTAAAVRSDFPVCLRISHLALGAGPALEAAEGGPDPLRDRVRCGLHLHGVHNPAMDHRITTTLARFVLAYVFVYYYVFVYVGCTFGLWLVFSASAHGRAAIATAARCLAAAFNRAWPDCRKLSRPAAVSPRFFGLPGRGGPHARYSVLVFLHGARGAGRNIRKPIQPARHAGADIGRDAVGLHDICGRAAVRPWRRRRLQLGCLFRLCRAALHPAACSRYSIAAIRGPGLGQLLHLSLAYLHRHDVARSCRRCASLDRSPISRSPTPSPLRAALLPCWPSERSRLRA